MNEAGEVLISGAGIMGHGIAVCFARAGWRVILSDPSAEALGQARQAMVQAFLLLAESDGTAPEQAENALSRISLVTQLPAAVPPVVVEAVPEQLTLKRQVLADLAARGTAETLLCTNTSALPISSLADGLPHAGRLVGTHFWNPPYVLPCVEVVRGDRTTEDTMDEALVVLESIGQQPVRIHQDVPGFVGNRLQHALQREALALVEQGVVSAEDLDRLVTNSFGLRLAVMGPFERADLGGLDTTCRVHEHLLPHLDRRTEPSRLLTEPVRRGELGAKTGKGFGQWNADELPERIRQRDLLLLRILQLRRQTEEQPDGKNSLQ
ncbi:MAG: hypothetical protein KDA79_19855 [Planctomycetaceae bacterium]|nr:hypothetical protein [Planctomycetaceae bacterium]